MQSVSLIKSLNHLALAILFNLKVGATTYKGYRIIAWINEHVPHLAAGIKGDRMIRVGASQQHSEVDGS